MCELGSFIMSKICGIALATPANPSFSHELAEKIKNNFFFGSWDVPHSIFLKISIFRPFWAHLGQNLTFLGSLRPSEGVFDVISGLFRHVWCLKHLKKWFELPERVNLGQVFGKKTEKILKNLEIENIWKNIFFQPER